MTANSLISVCPGCQCRVGVFPLLSYVPAEGTAGWKAEQARHGFQVREHRLQPGDRFQAAFGGCKCPTLVLRGVEAISRYREGVYGDSGTLPSEGEEALVLTATSKRWLVAIARAGDWYIGSKRENEEVLAWLPLPKVETIHPAAA